MWRIETAPEFDPELLALDPEVRIELFPGAVHSAIRAKRPRIDTLKGSKHANMKELRFDAAGGVWRMAFAFDPKRRAILLVAGDKSGVKEGRFYKELIGQADARFDAHLARLRKESS